MAVLLSERRCELGLFASLKTHLLARPRALLGVTACPDSLSVLTCSHQGVFNATSTQPLYLDCSSVCRTMASLSSRQLINFNFHWCFSMGGCPPAPSEASPPCAGFCSPLGLVAGKERGRPAPMVPFSSRSCPRACIHWGPWGGLRKAIRRPCCRKVVSGGLFLLAGSWRSPRRASSDGNYGVFAPRLLAGSTRAWGGECTAGVLRTKAPGTSPHQGAPPGNVGAVGFNHYFWRVGVCLCAGNQEFSPGSVRQPLLPTC